MCLWGDKEDFIRGGRRKRRSKDKKRKEKNKNEVEEKWNEDKEGDFNFFRFYFLKKVAQRQLLVSF